MYEPKLITAPTAYPLTVADVKAHAVVSIVEDDNYIGNVLIPAATEYAQAYQKRQLMPATWRLSIGSFPVGDGPIGLPLPPLVSITSITYVDTAGTPQTLSGSAYTADTNSEPGRVAPIYGTSWPSTRDGDLDAVQVTFVCGYGSTAAAALAAIPANTKLGMLVLCAHWYLHREDGVAGAIIGHAKHAVEALLLQDQCAVDECELEYA